MSTDDPNQLGLYPDEVMALVHKSQALNPVAVPKPPPSKRGSRKVPSLYCAWTRDVLHTLSPYLMWPIYERILQQIADLSLDGHALQVEPVKLKVPVRGNGKRERTFRQIVLRNTPELQGQLNALYETVRGEEITATGGRHLTLEEALQLDAPTFQALTTGRPVPESNAKMPRQTRRNLDARPVTDSE